MNAKEFAMMAHAGQVDKDGKPYFMHVERVARRVPDYYRQLAYLHDVIEDTNIMIKDIAREFDLQTANDVDALTREKDEKYFDYIDRVSNNPNARIIKIADLYDHLTHGDIPDKLRNRYLKALGILAVKGIKEGEWVVS